MAATIDVGTLYVAHAHWLQSWLRRHTRCPHRAFDLAQDTFCRLLERQHLPAPDDARNYLTTVARRLLIDDIRHREIERAYLDICAEAFDDSDKITPERIVEAVQLLDGLVQLLSAMPEEVREAFLLRRLEGQSHSAIAAALGISVSTVKRHITQAYLRCYAFAYPA